MLTFITFISNINVINNIDYKHHILFRYKQLLARK